MWIGTAVPETDKADIRNEMGSVLTEATKSYQTCSLKWDRWWYHRSRSTKTGNSTLTPSLKWDRWWYHRSRSTKAGNSTLTPSLKWDRWRYQRSKTLTRGGGENTRQRTTWEPLSNLTNLTEDVPVIVKQASNEHGGMLKYYSYLYQSVMYGDYKAWGTVERASSIPWNPM